MRFFRALVICLLALSPSMSKADFVIAVTAGGSSYQANSIATAVAGQPVTMSVWIRDPNGISRTITAYDLAFDIDATVNAGLGAPLDGKQYASGLSDFAISQNAALNANGGVRYQAPFSDDFVNFDLLVSTTGNSPGLTVDADWKKLFDITFKTTTNVAEGTYRLQFAPDALFGTVFQGPANSMTSSLDAGTLTALGGQFRITAVPEPSSLALVGLVSGGMCLARRRRASV